MKHDGKVVRHELRHQSKFNASIVLIVAGLLGYVGALPLGAIASTIILAAGILMMGRALYHMRRGIFS